MTIFFLFACTLGTSTMGDETGGGMDGGSNMSASDTNNGNGPSWGTSGGSGEGNGTSEGSNLRAGVFGMRDAVANASVIIPDSYDEVTLVVECPINIDNNYNISAFTVQVLNETTGDDTYWFGNDPLIRANIDLWDDTYCFWSEFRLDPGDVIIINGDIVGGEHQWLAESGSSHHCNVMVVEPGGAQRYLPTQSNWDGSGRDFVYDSGGVYY